MINNPNYKELVKLHKFVNFISAEFKKNIEIDKSDKAMVDNKKGNKKRQYAEATVLFFLLLDKDNDYNQNKLAKVCNLSKQSISVVINKLKKYGYVIITNNIIKLTSLGAGHANRILHRVLSTEIGALPTTTNTLNDRNYKESLNFGGLDTFCKNCTGFSIK